MKDNENNNQVILCPVRLKSLTMTIELSPPSVECTVLCLHSSPSPTITSSDKVDRALAARLGSSPFLAIDRAVQSAASMPCVRPIRPVFAYACLVGRYGAKWFVTRLSDFSIGRATGAGNIENEDASQRLGSAALALDVALDISTISRKHATLSWNPSAGVFQVKILSKNGGIVDGAVHSLGSPPVPLGHGSQLTFGGYTMTFELLNTIFDKDRTYTEPPFSYSLLIFKAISNSIDGKFRFEDICNYVDGNYHFVTKRPGWKYCIRHTLRLSQCFRKNEEGLWTIVASHHRRFEGMDVIETIAKEYETSFYAPAAIASGPETRNGPLMTNMHKRLTQPMDIDEPSHNGSMVGVML